MTKEQYLQKMKKIKRKNIQIQMKRNLRKEYLKRFSLPKIKLPSTSKIVLMVVFLLNLQIICFVEKAIMTYGDLSALYALIGMPVTIIPIVLGYYSKAKAENTAGGIVYDSAIMSQPTVDNEVNYETSSEDSVG